jgi:hypothetical protein
MSINVVRLYQGQPGTGNATLYTMPAGGVAAITEILLCNSTASAATVTLNVVPAGGTAAVTNLIVGDFSVPAKDVIVVSLSSALRAGDFIAGLQGTSAAVTVTICGERYQ